jgi:hypothetical protein
VYSARDEAHSAAIAPILRPTPPPQIGYPIQLPPQTPYNPANAPTGFQVPPIIGAPFGTFPPTVAPPHLALPPPMYGPCMKRSGPAGVVDPNPRTRISYSIPTTNPI